MDSVFEKFIRDARRLGLCPEYTAKVTEAGSKKRLVDIALDPNGMDFMCRSFLDGWGLSPDYISREFSAFINGGYRRERDGYTARMYVRPDTNCIEIDSTATLIMDYSGWIRIPANRPCELWLCQCHAVIESDSMVRVHLFNSTVSKSDDTPAKIIIDKF